MPELLQVTTYSLRDVPLDLWSQAKQRATMERMSLRDVLIALLRSYVTHGIPKGGKHVD